MATACGGTVGTQSDTRTIVRRRPAVTKVRRSRASTGVVAIMSGDQHAAFAAFSAKLPLSRCRAREGGPAPRHCVSFLHVTDPWPQGEPRATPEYLRAHAFDILAAVEQMFRIDSHGRADNLRRIPHRLHWLLWLLADLDGGEPLHG